jgi:trans-2,3-dihydro-3-hydroxyanthranilate isomerase
MRVARYLLCDVFADRLLTGIAIAVFTDARSFKDETMQALARELNLGESVFVLRPTVPEAEARIRIFTPMREVPATVTPVLGAALALSGPLSREVIRLETSEGVTPVRVARDDGRIVCGWLSRPAPTVRPFSASAALLRTLKVPGAETPIEIYDDGGGRQVLVELATTEAVAAVQPSMTELAAVCSAPVSVFSRTGLRWTTRVFVPALGILEAPVTGSVVGSLAVHLARHGRTPFNAEIVIEQGGETARPSTFYARAIGDGAAIERVEVGGNALVSARGDLTVP